MSTDVAPASARVDRRAESPPTARRAEPPESGPACRHRRPALARGRHRRRAPPVVAGGHDAQEPVVPVQPRRLARPPAHAVDPAAARGRPDGRHRHPQRRPVRRLGARPDRLRAPVGSSSTTRASRSSPSSWSGCSSARVLGLRQRVPGAAFAQVPGAGHHARHALHLPRHRTCTGPAASGSTPPTCPNAFQNLGTQQILGIPVLTILAVVVLGARRLLPAHRARRPRALRDRLRPGRRRPLRPARPAPRLRRLRPLRRARRARRRGLRRPLRHGHLGRPAPASSSRPSAAVVIGGVAIFGGSGTVCGAAIGAFLLVTINRGAADPRHPGLLAAAPSSAP